jgi:hypothetical protein
MRRSPSSRPSRRSAWLAQRSLMSASGPPRSRRSRQPIARCCQSRCASASASRWSMPSASTPTSTVDSAVRSRPSSPLCNRASNNTCTSRASPVANRLCLPAATAAMPTSASACWIIVASRCERTSTAISPGCTGSSSTSAMPARAADSTPWIAATQAWVANSRDSPALHGFCLPFSSTGGFGARQTVNAGAGWPSRRKSSSRAWPASTARNSMRGSMKAASPALA